jgi:hypothetical protein
LIALAVMRGAGPTPSGPETMASGPTPPPEVEAVLNIAMSRPCVSSHEAEAALVNDLAEIGYSDWTVTLALSAEATGCVVGSISASERRIHLDAALRPEVREALAQLANDMLDQCLTRSQAVELVESTLRAVGETGYELRTDGPRGGPIEREDEVMQHIAAGCYLYGGVGWKPDGTRVYMIGGRLE